MTEQGSVYVDRSGTGERVVFVHGGVMPAELIWSQQRSLGDRWAVELVDRRGFGRSPARGAEDYLEDAQDILEVLGAEGAHLVGFSYGGVAALVAAGTAPERIRSLTVVEPPLTTVAEDVPEVGDFRDGVVRLLATARPEDAQDRDWVLRMLRAIGSGTLPVPDPMPAWLGDGARQLVGSLLPTDARPDLAALREAEIPALVVSGGHHPAYEVIADRLAVGLAARREIIPGMGHGIPLTGAPFNDVLEQHLSSAARRGASR